MVYMESIEKTTKEVMPSLFGRHSWQLSDESDEEEGVTPLDNDSDTEDDDEADFDLDDDKFEEE